MRDTAGSAAAPTARRKNVRRNIFMRGGDIVLLLLSAAHSSIQRAKGGSDIQVVSTGTTKPAPVDRVCFLSPTGALAWRRNAPYGHRSGTRQSPKTQRVMCQSF